MSTLGRAEPTDPVVSTASDTSNGWATSDASEVDQSTVADDHDACRSGHGHGIYVRMVPDRGSSQWLDHRWRPVGHMAGRSLRRMGISGRGVRPFYRGRFTSGYRSAVGAVGHAEWPPRTLGVVFSVLPCSPDCCAGPRAGRTGTGFVSSVCRRRPGRTSGSWCEAQDCPVHPRRHRGLAHRRRLGPRRGLFGAGIGGLRASCRIEGTLEGLWLAVRLRPRDSTIGRHDVALGGGRRSQQAADHGGRPIRCAQRDGGGGGLRQ